MVPSFRAAIEGSKQEKISFFDEKFHNETDLFLHCETKAAASLRKAESFVKEQTFNIHFLENFDLNVTSALQNPSNSDVNSPK